MREGYSGTGPGVITPDGCAVELYSRLSAGNESDVIEAAAPESIDAAIGAMLDRPAGARILELGCTVRILSAEPVGARTRPVARAVSGRCGSCARAGCLPP